MPIIYEKKNRIATITINRPEVLNALNMKTLKELSQAFIDFRDDNDAWVLIITGTGERAFSAGFDLREKVPAEYPPLITRELQIWKPIIAAINGIALGGGCEIALACDFRIASNNLKMGVPEVKWGLMPGWGGTQRLPRLIGQARATQIIMMAEILDAQEANRLGLVNKIVPLTDLMPEANKWATRLCEMGPLALRAAKKAIISGSCLPFNEGSEIESNMFKKLIKSEDSREGQQAFIDKRKPDYNAK